MPAAVIYVGFTTGQRGIEADETGINTEGFSCRYFPQFKDFVVGYNGIRRGFALVNQLSKEVTVTGKVIVGSTSGLMAAFFNVAYTFANDVADFLAISGGTNAGGLYLDDVTIDQTAEGWRTASFKFSSDPNIT